MHVFDEMENAWSALSEYFGKVQQNKVLSNFGKIMKTIGQNFNISTNSSFETFTLFLNHFQSEIKVRQSRQAIQIQKIF